MEVDSIDRQSFVEQALARGRYTAIADRAGYVRQHVAGVIKGTRSYTEQSLRKIAEAAGVSEVELMEFRRRQRP